MRTHFKSNIYNNYQQILFCAILLFAIIIRIVGIDSTPPGINQDEAMAAVDAWALSKYGTDRFGMQLPVHFTAWEYGQMSVLLSYCMVPFIKIFGFSTFSIRLPMLCASVMGIILVYLISRKLFSEKLALCIMAFAAINPWHFMQSRWSLDCNLFPHIFLLGFYLLLCGFEKRKYLYLAMVFFGLTFYCYGVAVYSVPVFLSLYAAWCLWKKEFSLKEICISFVIFLAVALPEILTMFINMFKLPTIETPLFTIPYFPHSIRSNDILFLNFSFEQLSKNATSLWKQVFLQKPDAVYNTLPDFGPLYHISIPFTFLGIWQFCRHTFTQKDLHRKTLNLALCLYFFTGIWTGLTTYQVNLNRINIIFYALMFLTVYGMYCVVGWIPKLASDLRGGFIAAYSIMAIYFFTQYFETLPNQLHTMFNVDFVTIIQEADSLEEYDTLYVSSNVAWQTNYKMAEILTQYSCQIDALYYQGLTNETDGRELLPYSERYHFVDMPRQSSFDKEALYVVHQRDLQYMPTQYEVIITCGEFLAIDLE